MATADWFDTLGDDDDDADDADTGCDINDNDDTESEHDRRFYWLGDGFRAGALVLVVQQLEHLGLQRLDQADSVESNHVQDLALPSKGSVAAAVLYWVSRATPFELRQLRPWQHVNSVMGHRSLTLKYNLAHRIATCSRLLRENRGSASEALLDFWAPTYLVADDPIEQQRAIEAAERHRVPLIVKVSAQACGRGVFLAPTAARVRELLLSASSPCWPLRRSHAIAQHYITDPLLLDGYKFTLRVYALISCVEPLTIYVYSDAMVRLCSHRYPSDGDDDGSSWNDLPAHIDSLDLNQANEAAFNDTFDGSISHDGLRVDKDHLFESLRTERQADTDALWHQIRQLVARSILCAYDDLLDGAAYTGAANSSKCFVLLGYDVLIDRTLKPWLLEINHLPSLIPHSELANELKRRMLADLFAIVDPMAKRAAQHDALARAIWAARGFELQHQGGFASRHDVAACVRLDSELDVRGGFELVFPTDELVASIVVPTSQRLPSEPLRKLLWWRRHQHQHRSQQPNV